MTKKELEFINKILLRTKPRDQQIEKALSYVEKDLAQYAARKGQLMEQYDYDPHPW